MARCFYHPETEAIFKCSVCGKPLCSQCVIQQGERHLCPRCARHDARRPIEGATQKEGPTWIGLLIPGLAQLLRGQMYKGAFLLVYFLVALDAGSPFFQPLAYVLSIWDYFSPLVQEESKSARQLDFQWFLGMLLVIIGVMTLFLGQLGRYLPAKGSDLILSVSTVALGAFLVWYHTRRDRKEDGV